MSSVVLQVSYQGTVRGGPISSDEINYSGVTQAIPNMFPELCNPPKYVFPKYLDEEGDACTLCEGNFDDFISVSMDACGDKKKVFLKLDLVDAPVSDTAALTHAINAGITKEYLSLLDCKKRIPLGLCPCKPHQRYEALLEQHLPTLAAALQCGPMQETLRSEPELSAVWVASLQALSKAPGLHRWYAPFGRRRRLGRMMQWAASALASSVQSGDSKPLAKQIREQMQAERNDNEARGLGRKAQESTRKALCAYFGAGGLLKSANPYGPAKIVSPDI